MIDDVKPTVTASWVSHTITEWHVHVAYADDASYCCLLVCAGESLVLVQG